MTGDAAELPPDDVPWKPATLDARSVFELRRPFSPEAIQFRPMGKVGKDGKARAVFYIDARLVVDRLNQVVGPENWSDSYEPLLRHEAPGHHFPVECALTVFGVVKRDVGQTATVVLDDKCWKSAYSDALKRAGVKFGVGAFLYSIPPVRVKVDTSGEGDRVRILGFSREGTKALTDAYARWLGNPALNPFGPPLDAAPYQPAAPVDPAAAGSGEDTETTKGEPT